MGATEALHGNDGGATGARQREQTRCGERLTSAQPSHPRPMTTHSALRLRHRRPVCDHAAIKYSSLVLLASNNFFSSRACSPRVPLVVLSSCPRRPH
jgi:hypothetical protein